MSFLFLLGAACLSSAGCFAVAVGAVAGAGGVIWAKGALNKEYSESLEKVYRATKVAMGKLDLPLLLDRKDELSAKIESEFSDGKKIWIEVEYVSKYTTKVSIRVGTLGDELRSREISDMINQSFK